MIKSESDGLKVTTVLSAACVIRDNTGGFKRLLMKTLFQWCVCDSTLLCVCARARQEGAVDFLAGLKIEDLY